MLVFLHINMFISYTDNAVSHQYRLRKTKFRAYDLCCLFIDMTDKLCQHYWPSRRMYTHDRSMSIIYCEPQCFDTFSLKKINCIKLMTNNELLYYMYCNLRYIFCQIENERVCQKRVLSYGRIFITIQCFELVCRNEKNINKRQSEDLKFPWIIQHAMFLDNLHLHPYRF